MATIDKLKMLFGFLLLAVLGVLGWGIAIQHVHAEASFGLEFILGTLTTMGGAFANWAFGATSAGKTRQAETTGGESQEIVKS